MNVFLRELVAYRKSTIVWVVSLCAIVVLFMALYPAFTNDVAASKQVLSSFPETLRAAINLNLGNFFTIYGFYGYLLSFAILAAAIQAMNVGTSIISKEVAGKTADFLLSKPISRSRVITAKLGAALAVILTTSVAFAVVSYLIALAVAKDAFGAGTFFLMSSTLFLVQLVFVSLGALFAAAIPRVKSVISVTLPTVFAFYIIGAIGDVLGSDKVRYVSPFRFFDTNYIINNNSLDTKYLLVEAVIVVAAIALAYVIYIKKDVRASA